MKVNRHKRESHSLFQSNYIRLQSVMSSITISTSSSLKKKEREKGEKKRGEKEKGMKRVYERKEEKEERI